MCKDALLYIYRMLLLLSVTAHCSSACGATTYLWMPVPVPVPVRQKTGLLDGTAELST